LVDASLGGRGDDEESGAEHGPGDPAVPGNPAENLKLFNPGEALAALKRLLDLSPPPARSR
jgi:hypothetical protein